MRRHSPRAAGRRHPGHGAAGAARRQETQGRQERLRRDKEAALRRSARSARRAGAVRRPAAGTRRPRSSAGRRDAALRRGARRRAAVAVRRANASADERESRAARRDAAAGPASSRRPCRGRRSPMSCRAARWSSIAGVVVLAVLVLGTVLALTLGDDDKGNGRRRQGATPAASAGAGRAGGDTEAALRWTLRQPRATAGEQDGGKRTARAGKGGRRPDGDVRLGRRPASRPRARSVPAGFKTVTNQRFHFSMAMPEGWKYVSTSARDELRRHLQRRRRSCPRPDRLTRPRTTRRRPGRTRSRRPWSSTRYKHIGIEKVGYRGYPTVADWEFDYATSRASESACSTGASRSTPPRLRAS